MTRQQRMEDIKNRHDLALAERNFTQPGTENYKILSEVAESIRKEYQRQPRGKRIRNGFRLYGGKYHPVILSDCERI